MTDSNDEFGSDRSAKSRVPRCRAAISGVFGLVFLPTGVYDAASHENKKTLFFGVTLRVTDSQKDRGTAAAQTPTIIPNRLPR